MYIFVVDVPKKHSQAVQSFLDSKGIDYGIVGRKALGFPESILVIAASLTIARHLYFFIQELRKEERPDVDIRIRVYREHEFGKTQHQVATQEELVDAIKARPPDHSSHGT